MNSYLASREREREREERHVPILVQNTSIFGTWQKLVKLVKLVMQKKWGKE